MGHRRGSGEGSISRRSDGRWMARIDLGYVDGQRKRKYIYGKTRKEVAERLNSIGGKFVLAEPKTTKSQRTLPLPPMLVTALHQHRVRQLEARLVAGGRWREHSLVFPPGVGTPIQPSNLLRAFDALLKRAGLPHMRFHDLRHSCATLLAVQGVPPRVAMEILGHSNIHTTLNIYTHVLDDSKREALAAMDRLLEQAGAG